MSSQQLDRQTRIVLIYNAIWSLEKLIGSGTLTTYEKQRMEDSLYYLNGIYKRVKEKRIQDETN